MPQRSNPQNRQARSDLTVRDILEATFLLIKSEKKLNMQSIADRAGVSIGTVYHHFESKSDLMTAAFSAYLDDVYEQIFRACTKPAGMRKPLLKTIFREAFTYLQTSVCVRSFLARPPASAEQAWMEFANRTATLMATSLADAEKEQEMIHIKGLIRARLEGVRSMLVSTSLGRHQSLEEITPSLVNILVEFCETAVRPISGITHPSTMIADTQQPKGVISGRRYRHSRRGSRRAGSRKEACSPDPNRPGGLLPLKKGRSVPFRRNRTRLHRLASRAGSAGAHALNVRLPSIQVSSTPI